MGRDVVALAAWLSETQCTRTHFKDIIVFNNYDILVHSVHTQCPRWCRWHTHFWNCSARDAAGNDGSLQWFFYLYYSDHNWHFLSSLKYLINLHISVAWYTEMLVLFCTFLFNGSVLEFLNIRYLGQMCFRSLLSNYFAYRANVDGKHRYIS